MSELQKMDFILFFSFYFIFIFIFPCFFYLGLGLVWCHYHNCHDFFFLSQQFITWGMMAVCAYRRNYVWSINTLNFFYAVTQHKGLLRNWTHNLK